MDEIVNPSAVTLAVRAATLASGARYCREIVRGVRPVAVDCNSMTMGMARRQIAVAMDIAHSKRDINAAGAVR